MNRKTCLGIFIFMDITYKQQIQNWEKLYGKPISETEYNEICQNLNEFFSILKKWDDVERKLSENERTTNNGSKYIPNTP